MLSDLRVGTRLLVIIAAVLIPIAAIFLMVLENTYEDHLNELILKRISTYELQVVKEQNADIKAMSTALDIFARRDELKRLYLASDREGLYEQAAPLFEGFNRAFGVSLFYVLRPDGTVFLRLHDKDHYGDNIDRVVVAKALAIDGAASAIEVGMTALALRTAVPYYDQDELIGYLEAGVDLGHILDGLTESLDDVFIFASDKWFLDREKWSSMRQATGLPDNWDVMNDHVWVNEMPGTVLANRCFSGENIEDKIEHGTMVIKDFPGLSQGFACGAFILDSTVEGEHHLGIVAFLLDVKAQIDLSKKAFFTLSVYLGSSLLLGSVLLWHLAGRYITRPVNRLVTAAQGFADGDFSHRIEFDSAGEIGLLSSAMNDMASRLEDLYANLEARVEDKTRDLKASCDEITSLNDELQVALLDMEMQSKELDANNKELKKVNVELKGLEKLKTEFLQSISHELRSPLTPILGYLELMRDESVGGLSTMQRDIVNEMYVCGKNLQMVVDELLEVASLQARRLFLSFEELDLHAVLRDVFHDLVAMAEENNIVVELSIPSEPAFVVGDRSKLIDIFTHLFRNAVKFNAEMGKITVTSKPGKDAIDVVVEDSGIGIAQDRLDRIFDAFYQGESSSARYYEGVGLGLYLVKRFVDIHNGTIRVKSEEGAGTRFTISIPKNRQGKVA